LLELNGPGPTVPELAEACGMSGRRLASSYKRSTGVTLRHYMSETRLARAKRLLESSGAPIKQIAYDSGFGSSSAFVAAFRLMNPLISDDPKGPLEQLMVTNELFEL